MMRFLSVNFLLTAVFLSVAVPVQAADDHAPFAVIELFTSEGCSSCPPADKLLSEMVAQSKSNPRIIPLEFHVDYWNYLGWEDPFSSRDFSQRQRRYAQALKSSSVYTPQMIINGQTAFGGYRKDKLRESLKKALQTPAEIGVTISGVEHQKNTVTVSCGLTDIDRQANLLVAVVERHLSTAVPRGENAGRTLPHDNVVRAFKAVPVNDFTHTVTLSLPQNLKPKNATVVAYLQDRSSMHILGAAAAPFVSDQKR